jgi:hypothetical protein
MELSLARSCRVTMLGWFSADAARASCKNRRPVAWKDFDSDGAVQARVPGQENLAHAAGSQQPFNPVGTKLRARGKRGQRRIFDGLEATSQAGRSRNEPAWPSRDSTSRRNSSSPSQASAKKKLRVSGVRANAAW